MSFRKMTLLANNVEKDTINKFLGYNFEEHCMEAVANAKEKWEKRLKREPIVIKVTKEVLQQERSSVQRRYMPRELAEYTNMLTAICPMCPGKVARACHLNTIHNKNVPSPSELWDLLKQFEVKQTKITRRGVTEKVNRRKTTNLRGNIVGNYITEIKSVLDCKEVQGKALPNILLTI